MLNGKQQYAHQNEMIENEIKEQRRRWLRTISKSDQIIQQNLHSSEHQKNNSYQVNSNYKNNVEKDENYR